jgi:hypothetical protein
MTHDITADYNRDTAALSAGSTPGIPKAIPKAKLLTRSQLDGRTQAARLFDKLVSEIESDLGGADRLSTIERTLIEAYVGAAITLASLNTKLALGQPIDLAQHAQTISAMVRVASRLGLSRRAREVPNLLSESEDAECQ